MAGSVCLTYDDLFVDQWLSARRLFDKFNARVTFCVSHLHKATPEQLAGLRLLQSDGHEIGYHTRTHPRLKPYLATHGLDHWLNHEIDKGIAEHRAAGFPATSFASPYHGSTEQTRTACARRFAVIRAGGPRNVDKKKAAKRVYNELGPARAINCLGFADIQHGAFPGWVWQTHLFDLIADRGGTGVFVGHGIRASKDGPGLYATHEQLRRFLLAATLRGLVFRTMTDFAKATA
ncbi:MAG: polysaccharide deacetylase family protein [Pseudomonadota bacterium]